jgi:hypothetical protein
MINEMLSTNPFHGSGVPAFMDAAVMQNFVILMVALVVLGVLLDMKHKKNAKYFFENSAKAKMAAKRSVSSGEKLGIAARVIANEVVTAGEFQNAARRISHLFMMYGFIAFLATTGIMLFSYPAGGVEATPTILPTIWTLSALSLAVGGYWFWFAIRVDANSEGVKLFDLRRADLFILSLLGMSTFALLWSGTQANGAAGWATLFYTLFMLSTFVLAASTYWSKLGHMFFKPAAAFQKHVTRADGGREGLPTDYDLNDPATHAKFPDVPEYMGKNPVNMGPGIKREAPNHY